MSKAPVHGPRLFLVVALPAEARPLISRFKLNQSSQVHGFRCYERDHVHLLVSGMGRSAAAAAVAYGQGRFAADADQIWVNIGIAGHQHLPVGTLVRAGRIIDQHSGQNWYPPLVTQTPVPIASVCTVDQAQSSFHDDNVYEMEAAGFYESAVRFASAELVQCFKVVSDNQWHSAETITAAAAAALIDDNVPVLMSAVEQLLELGREIAEDPELAEVAAKCQEHCHFSAYQQRELARLLRQHKALAGNCQAVWPLLSAAANSKQLLACLRQFPDQLPFHLSER